jgi:glycosyltransferase involved in cell wall biosynthesis
MNERVCILIPTYNRCDFLVQAIESARRQTYRGPIDIIVLDDRSPDETAAVVAPVVAVDPRVRYVCHPKNVGIAENWRIGIELASDADFFCLLHDDDTYEPTFVERLVEPLINDPGAVMSFCDHWVMYSDGRRSVEETEKFAARFGRRGLPAGPLADFAKATLVDFSISIGASLFRRKMVRPDMIDAAAKGAIDYWLLMQCVRTGGRAVYCPERLMNYRLHGDSMSASQPLQMAPGHLRRVEIALSDPLFDRFDTELRRQLCSLRTDYGLALLAVGRYKDARAELSLAVAGGDVSRRTRFAWAASRCGPAGRLLVAFVRNLKRLSASQQKKG